MGKVSTIFVFLLMINIIGYIIFVDMVSVGVAVGNPYITGNNLLTTLYSNVTVESGETVFLLDEDSEIFDAIPQEPPLSFIENAGQFIDRIFILFEFVRMILGVLVFPIALLSFMQLPWALTMLLFPPLTTLYVLGIIDLLSGGNS